MRLKLGYRIAYQLPQPTPMITLLNVHFSRAGDLERPDHMITTPAVPLRSYRDSFGNWCTRLIAPAGEFVLECNTVIRDSGQPDASDQNAEQIAVEDLPDETISYLLGSRYCDTDVLSEEAWNLFQNTPTGRPRVQAICDYVHNHIRFDYMSARSTRTASQALAEGVGVCRDFAHLAVAFCRCMNIPARYCTGYLSDIGTPEPHAPGDFAAYIEVYLGGTWHIFDPRNNKPRIGRVLIAYGRDASDVPLTHSFGPNMMTKFEVWSDPLPEDESSKATNG